MSRIKRNAGALASLLYRVLGSRVASRSGILLYHRVQPLSAGLPSPPFNVTPEVFREQLTGLLERNFRFVSLEELSSARQRGKMLPPRSVVVTFDDGFASVFYHAIPILRELRIPSTIFIATGYLDSRHAFPMDWWGRKYERSLASEAYRPLSIQECRELQKEGIVELGAHTHTHEDFRGRPADLLQDLHQCRTVMEEEFSCSSPAFAFPFGKTHLGYAGPKLAAAARKSGMRCGLTTDCRTVDPLDEDPFTWGRFSCSQWDTSAHLAGKLGGWYGWTTQLQVLLDQIRGPENVTLETASKVKKGASRASLYRPDSSPKQRHSRVIQEN